MSESRAWVEHGARVHLLVPEAGAAEFSPDDTYLAWVDGLAPTIVHVTEVATMRAVATLHGGPVAALCWRGDDTLCVFQSLHGEPWMRAHAIPDAGVVARVKLPWVRGWMRVQTSADTRSALVTWPRSLSLGSVSLGACVLRGDRLETARVLDDGSWRDDALGARATIAMVALSPDGETLAVAGRAPDRDGATWCEHVRGDGERLHRASMPARHTPTALRWIGAAKTLAVWSPSPGAGKASRVWIVDAPDTAAEVHLFVGAAVARAPVSIDLDPARERVVITALHAVGTRAELRAQVVSCDPCAPPQSPQRAIVLSRQPNPDVARGHLGGGACWDALGHLVTLAPATRVEARLSRRATPDDTPHAELHFALTGASPHALTLTPSPTRRHALARWETRDRGDGVDPAHRLALIALT